MMIDLPMLPLYQERTRMAGAAGAGDGDASHGRIRRFEALGDAAVAAMVSSLFVEYLSGALSLELRQRLPHAANADEHTDAHAAHQPSSALSSSR